MICRSFLISIQLYAPQRAHLNVQNGNLFFFLVIIYSFGMSTCYYPSSIFDAVLPEAPRVPGFHWGFSAHVDRFLQFLGSFWWYDGLSMMILLHLRVFSKQLSGKAQSPSAGTLACLWTEFNWTQGQKGDKKDLQVLVFSLHLSIFVYFCFQVI